MEMNSNCVIAHWRLKKIKETLSKEEKKPLTEKKERKEQKMRSEIKVYHYFNFIKLFTSRNRSNSPSNCKNYQSPSIKRKWINIWDWFGLNMPYKNLLKHYTSK